MTKAIWNDVVLAESDETVVVEGNHYFPRDSVNEEYFHANDSHTVCPWKGVASYFDIVIGEARNSGAAWTYPDPKPAAADIRDHVAFWRGVKVES